MSFLPIELTATPIRYEDDGGGGASPTEYSFNITIPADTDYLRIDVGMRVGSDRPLTKLEIGGVSFLSDSVVHIQEGINNFQLISIMNPPTGVDLPVVIEHDGYNSNNAFVAHFVPFRNVASVSDWASNDGDSTSPSVTVDSTEDEVVIGTTVSNALDDELFLDSPATEVYKRGTESGSAQSDNCWVVCGSLPGAATSTTMEWTIDDERTWISVATALLPKEELGTVDWGNPALEEHDDVATNSVSVDLEITEDTDGVLLAIVHRNDEAESAEEAEENYASSVLMGTSEIALTPLVQESRSRSHVELWFLSKAQLPSAGVHTITATFPEQVQPCLLLAFAGEGEEDTIRSRYVDSDSGGGETSTALAGIAVGEGDVIMDVLRMTVGGPQQLPNPGSGQTLVHQKNEPPWRTSAMSRKVVDEAGTTNMSWSWEDPSGFAHAATAFTGLADILSATITQLGAPDSNDTRASFEFTTFDAEAGVQHDVYRHTASMAGDPVANGTLVESDVDPTEIFVDDGRDPDGTSTFYQVVSTDGEEVALSNEIEIVTAPARPTGVTVSDETEDGWKTSWTEQADPSAWHRMYFREQGSGDPWSVGGERDPSETGEIVVSGLDPAVYEVTVTAFDGALESGMPDAATADLSVELPAGTVLVQRNGQLLPHAVLKQVDGQLVPVTALIHRE